MSAADRAAPAERHAAYFAETWDDATPADNVRFVVLDSETTGLNPKTDRLVTIGAVAVQAGDIVLADSYEALIQVAYNTAAVTVHGVTRDEAQAGLPEAEAIEGFLDYLRDGVIVGHHIGHDIETFNVAYRRHFGFELQNRSIDTMELTLHLERDGAFAGQDEFHSFSLDALLTRFGITPHDRHTAPGDAFLTALTFQRLLRLGERHGRKTLGGLAEPYESSPPS